MASVPGWATGKGFWLMGRLFHPEPDQGGRFRGCDFLFIYVSRWESVWRNLDWNLLRVRVRTQYWFVRRRIWHSWLSSLDRLHARESEGAVAFPIHAWQPRGRGNKGIKSDPSYPPTLSQSRPASSSNAPLLTPFPNPFPSPTFPLPDASNLGTLTHPS